MPDDLTLRQLNRATLARQLLLARERVAPVEAIERLGGLQAQEPKPAFAALWTRLEGFRREQLHEALTERAVVRGTMMRATLHMASAGDYAALRTSLQPMLTGAMNGILRQRGDVDVDRVLPVARTLLERAPAHVQRPARRAVRALPRVRPSRAGLRGADAAAAPDGPQRRPLVVPADAPFALAERWIDEPLTGEDLRGLVRRHLAAFGPAGRRRRAGVVRAEGPQGRRRGHGGGARRVHPNHFSSGTGQHGRRTLYDLPDAPRPDEDAPAPPRLLPEFDSLLLAHQDRTRVVDDARRKALATKNLRVQAVFLVDGFVAGSWAIERKRGTATLTLSAFERLAKPVKDELAAEAEALLAFLEDGATPRVAFAQR